MTPAAHAPVTAAPDAAARLNDLAFNLWWTWHPEVIELFREMDPALWRETNHNPLTLLRRLGDDEVASRVAAHSLEARINFHHRRMQEYLLEPVTWCAQAVPALLSVPQAYFSAEFGLHECLPLYSGGLGVLAGDFIKSASDLGLPVVGVGLYYARGYFHQHVDESGWQQERYDATLTESLPLRRAADEDGSHLVVSVPFGEGVLHAGVWIAHVGRLRLLLLDSNVPENVDPAIRDLTASLYGGDNLTRIRQELLLGVGGMRALRAIGIRPAVLHLNEGHCAFAILERVRERIDDDGLPFDTALRETAIQSVFTTHTPVDAGHDRFDAALVEQELGWLRARLGLDPRAFMALGRVRAENDTEPFCMTVLGLKARQRNGVSRLHGHVSRRMWQPVWSAPSDENVPIGHITNGVHSPSWLAPSMKRIYDRVLGNDWMTRQWDVATWRPIDRIADDELWDAHAALRRKLVNFVRLRQSSGALDPDALTIGFGRRFATYKRATLLVGDLERLAQLIGDTNRPVQFLFAGKAHPRDDAGKSLIRQIVALSRQPRFADRLLFIEDYDINVGRHLVQGVDIWLNTPLRPLEACGTSGQKVLLNGGLNCSVLDGWWAEAYDGENGFAIGTTHVHHDPNVQQERDRIALYQLLERTVVPMFYDRDTGPPARWVHRMKRAIVTLGWRFNADRMVMDYATGCYAPAAGVQSSHFFHV